MIAIGRAIKLIRIQRGWSQEYLAQIAQFPRSYVSRVELGRIRYPALNIIERFANAYGTEVWKIIRYAEKLENYEYTGDKAKIQQSTIIH
jgi:transcriptional regulator with XRE-family HTH domain